MWGFKTPSSNPIKYSDGNESPVVVADLQTESCVTNLKHVS